MARTNEEIVWKKSRSDMFQTFAVELKEFTQTGKLPDSCDLDMKYCLELQRKRQKDKNIIMKYEFVPRGHFAEGGGVSKGWEDERYKTRMEYRTCRWERMIYRDKKRVYNSKENIIFYQMITDTQNEQLIEDESYTCPNCSAISKVKELLNGCPYCGTFFKIEDLFPKVTNFFMIKDQGGTEKEVNRSILKTMLPCMMFFLVVNLFNCMTQGEEELLLSLIPAILAGVVGGGIFGYILWAILTIGSIFKQAGKSISMVFSATGSGKRFETQMKNYSPEFSYEYFTGKVISMLKMLIYAEDPQELPIYLGEPIGDMCWDIVDSYYSGALALKKFEIKGNYCYVTVDAYVEDVYDAERVRKKRDIFNMVLCRNINTPIQMNFSIKKIQCRSCGGSFDATKQRTCPSCDTRYEIEDDDWVVLSIKKK